MRGGSRVAQPPAAAGRRGKNAVGYPRDDLVDPRHSFDDNQASLAPAGSRIGPSRSARRDPRRELVRAFGDIAGGQETAPSASTSRCTGWPTSPPEPRWARTVGTFGEDFGSPAG